MWEAREFKLGVERLRKAIAGIAEMKTVISRVKRST
jgi:hypothetical protein